MRSWTMAFALTVPLAVGSAAVWTLDTDTTRQVLVASTSEEAVALHLQLGTKGGDLKIIPSALNLWTGKPYNLVITNQSNVAHVLAMPEFAATVEHSSSPAFPYKPAEIDVAVGETVEWYFTPAKAGVYKMGCALQDHADAGMHGWIVVH